MVDLGRIGKSYHSSLCRMKSTISPSHAWVNQGGQFSVEVGVNEMRSVDQMVPAVALCVISGEQDTGEFGVRRWGVEGEFQCMARLDERGLERVSTDKEERIQRTKLE